jgi:hypothetical protein
MSSQYLFADQATIHDVVENQRKTAKRILEELPRQTILARSVEDLTAEMVEQFRLHVPVIERTGIVQLPNEEVEIDVSHEPGRYSRDRGPHFVKGTALRVSVPFTGEAVLFNFGVSPYNSPIAGEIMGGSVILSHAGQNPDPIAVRREFENRLGQIENMLHMVRGPADEWNQQLPDLVRSRLEQRRAKLERDEGLNLGYPEAPAQTLPDAAANPVPEMKVEKYDLFLSHASEDKDVIARPLYQALVAEGFSVWFDEAVLELGDSLRRKIDDGLAKCRYGIVILSPRFLAKHWPQRELDGLVARETASGEKAIIPIWHELDHDTLMRYSPTLADRFAGRSEEGIPGLVQKILRVLRH